MYTRSTIPIAFDGNDLDPALLIATAIGLKAAIDRANAMPPAARVAIASSPMGDAARALFDSLAQLASCVAADDPGDMAIPPSQPTGMEICHVYDGSFIIPFAGAQSIEGKQKALWIIKRVAGGSRLQAHGAAGRTLEWAGDVEEWNDTFDPESSDLWHPTT